ncbi:unnamed protein product [Mycena citricolor]|uniref:tRNA-dihydrouridine(16/17) synthase [NAD(P)(+)] n=1 Tax=Mycena citricolor TaxID=2018698 RepID=A0AAD2GXE3_9AGAR|nr:unnamed protein product [Mycena citricolor]
MVSQEIPKKLEGYEFYRQVLGSPKYIVAPMVDQSELAFRILCRRYGSQLIYTPMINARKFVESAKLRTGFFDMTAGEEGHPDTDRPLMVQFCANDPEFLLKAAKMVEKDCDGVDINLGCPQDIARRGHYGSFLQDEWDLIFSLINTLHKNLAVPVTAKFRIFPTIEKTVEYAKMLERAGAQILTCHGRLREQRGHNTGLASFAHIKAVKENVSVPVFANGNVLYQEDIETCLRETGCDGVMSAEGILYNPALFAGLTEAKGPESVDPDVALLKLQPSVISLAKEYLSIVGSLRTHTPYSAVKGHLFKILRPALMHHIDLRNRLGEIRVIIPKGKDRPVDQPFWATGLETYLEIVTELGERLKADEERERGGADGETRKSLTELVSVQEETGLKILPWWLAQPYWRPLPEGTVPGTVPSTGNKRPSEKPVGAEGPEKRPRVDRSS